MSNTIRLTGMATGMDTDTTVKQLMKPYQLKIDKLNQEKQLVTWKQEAYREVVSDINAIKSTFFDILKPDSYMLSKNSYSSFETKAYDTGSTNISAGVSVTAAPGASTGNYKVDFNGGQIATAAGFASNAKVQLSAGGDAKSTTLLSDIGIMAESTITVIYNNGDDTGLTSATIDIDPAMTLSELAKAINTGTDNKVNARFSEMTGKFSFQTSGTGTATSIEIQTEAADNFVEKLNLGNPGDTNVAVDLNSDIGDSRFIIPHDLSVKITTADGTTTQINQDTNSITADGVTYKFTTGAKSSDITITQNSQNAFDKIKSFVDKYNELVDKYNTKTDEKKQYTYLPLSDEQKKAMSETDITAWETKAKTGLLKGDSSVQNVLSSLRNAFYDSVKDAGIRLTDIGISTTSDYAKRGRIIFDETKLKDTILQKGDQLAELFTKKSTSFSAYSPDLSIADRKTRYNEEGIFQRISDIFNDYTRTVRDKNGKKGMFIEKAGIKGDYSEYTNLLTTELNTKQGYIDKQVKKMSEKESAYYLQFSKLETSMNKLNSQSSWLSQQLGTSSSQG